MPRIAAESPVRARKARTRPKEKRDLLRIVQPFGGDAAQDRQESFSVPACHGKVHVKAVAASGRCSAGNIAFVSGDVGEEVVKQGCDAFGGSFACHEQVKAGSAAHGTEVDDGIGDVGSVAQVNSADVFDGMNFGGVDDRFAVGGGHTDVEGCDGFGSDAVNARDINAR